MLQRHYSVTDHLLGRLDNLLRLLSGHQSTAHTRPSPSAEISEATLSTKEQQQVAGFMRVNYAGEVCAQALYQGQALTTHNTALKQQLTHAGLEEQDHLAWCQTRLQALNSHVSVLNPVWYAGSFLLGMAAGLAGDRWNLGFLAETERQVTQHLEYHLQHLPTQDEKTRAILLQMRDEEAQHAHMAETHGGTALPLPLRYAMRFTAKIMTTTAYWV